MSVNPAAGMAQAFPVESRAISLQMNGMAEQRPMGDWPAAAEWLPHRYDETHDTVHFFRVPREIRKSVPFLTDEYLKLAEPPTIIGPPFELAAKAEPGAVHFIFHSAYCCSTLLAQALDIPGTAQSLSEPQILNDMVGWRHRNGNPTRIGATIGDVLHLLSRPFQPDEATIIKPSNIVNGLAEAMMTMRPNAKCVLLYAPLRVFLTSVARKGMWGRLWVRELLSRQLVDGLVDLGFEPRDYLLHTDLQTAAVGWLAQHRLFARMAQRWPDRIRTLDSEMLVDRPADALSSSAAHFGFEIAPNIVSSIVHDVFARNAKTGLPFAAGQRKGDRQSGEVLHADEIEKVVIWAEAVAQSAGINFELSKPLLHI